MQRAVLLHSGNSCGVATWFLDAFALILNARRNLPFFNNLTIDVSSIQRVVLNLLPLLNQRLLCHEVQQSIDASASGAVVGDDGSHGRVFDAGDLRNFFHWGIEH